MPRVSVIVPAFNAEEHIAETLQSVIKQTYTDWEVVVGDDGSTDETVLVARSFGPNVCVVESPANAGPAAARNLAIANASGELLAFLDSDDYWMPSYLDHQVRLYDASVGRPVGIVACNARMLGPDGFLPGTYSDYVGAAGEVTVARLLTSNPVLTSAICPRRVVEEVGGFAVELRLAEDHDLWLRIVERGYRVLATDEPLHVYRVRATSLSADPVGLAEHTLLVCQRALARGNLSRKERRIARREARLQRAVARIATSSGISYPRVLTSFPLVALVVAENPRRWASFARRFFRRDTQFARPGSR